MQIVANGYRDKKLVNVFYDEKTDAFLFNDVKNDFFEEEMRYEMSLNHPIGGTFYASNAKDLRNIINVIVNYFYDKPTLDVKCSEEVEPIPQDGGKDAIY